MRRNRAWIRKRIIALGVIALLVPLARHVILCEGNRAEYRRQAIRLRRQADSFDDGVINGIFYRPPKPSKWRRYTEQWAEKYEWAALLPWLPIPPDPQWPE